MAASSDEVLRVIRIWAAVAWADGFISEAEATAMRAVIDAAGLEGELQAQALGYLDEEVGLSTEGLEEVGAAERAGIYRAAVRLAHVDLDLAARELTLLERLRQGLSIDESLARELEAEAEAPVVSGGLER